jgi:phage FluMu gp28-like protein
MRALSPNDLLPYQQRWVEDQARVAIGEKSRRIGWSFASAMRAVDRRLFEGTDLYYTSADLSAAREFIEACGRWARAYNAVADDLGSQVIDEREGITAFVLRFPHNGARIVAGSSNPKFFRSKGGDADADEFAFHADPRELYKAMQPAALVWGHQLRVWSTHNGEGSYFARMVKGAREADFGLRILDFGLEEESDTSPPDSNPKSAIQNPKSPSLHSVSLLDAVNQGLVERVRKLDAPDPIARRDFIESIRASCPDEDAWNEEYLCKPASGQAALLSYPVIEGCEDARLRILDFGLRIENGNDAAADLPQGSAVIQSKIQNPQSKISSILFAGFDVGRKHDRSVLWVLEQIGDVFWTRQVRVMEGATFTAQEQLLNALMNNRSVKRLCIDATGIGAMLAERLTHRWGRRVEAVTFTAPVKAELAMPLLRLFQDRLVRIPSDAAVREDLHKVRKIVTASHNVRLDAPRDADGHADRFWALALAYHASDSARGTRRQLPSLARKPVGW